MLRYFCTEQYLFKKKLDVSPWQETDLNDFDDHDKGEGESDQDEEERGESEEVGTQARGLVTTFKKLDKKLG